MNTSQVLTDILKVLEAGIPLDHPTRQDARIAQLEEAMKALIGHVLSLGENPGGTSDGVITQGPGPDPTQGPNQTWLQT